MNNKEINKQVLEQLAIRKKMKKMGYKKWATLADQYGISKEAIRQRAFRLHYKLLRLKEND